MSEQRAYHGNTRPFDLLPEADVEKIVGAAFELMRDIGLKFDPEPRAMELLSGAGCEILSDGVVKFPEALVRKSIASVAKGFRLWDRPGAEHIEFSEKHTVFTAGVTCPNVIDLETRGVLMEETEPKLELQPQW